MAYSANDFQKMIEQYAESPEGRKFLMSQNVPTKSYWYTDGERIANELKKDLIEGFLAIVNEPGAVFDENAVSIIPHYEKVYGKDRYGFRILFTDAALSRPSLYNEQGSPLGSGVYDIFGLFTNGYQASNFVYGYWMHTDSSGQLTEATQEGGPANIIRSRRYLMGNDFINHIMHAYQTMYPDIIFKWPKEWGGNY